MRFLSGVAALLLLSSTQSLVAALGTNAPTSQRLAYGSFPGSMSVGFNTAAILTGAPTVRYSTTAAMTNALTATSSDMRTYIGSTVYYSYVQLTNLQPYTQYFYQIVLDASNTGGSDTAVASFFTSRAAGDHTPHTVNFIGDLGVLNGEATMNSLTANFAGNGVNNKVKPDFLLHVGDISYADDFLTIPSNSVYDYEQIYNSYQSSMSAVVSSSAAYMVLPGNHEVSGPANTVNFTPYRNRWNMPYTSSTTNQTTAGEPSKQTAQGGSMWYSFDNGMTHYCMLDFESDLHDHGFTEGQGELNFAQLYSVSQQRHWLAADLAAVNRTATPWLIVGGHRPMYTAREHGPTAWLLAQFEPLFTQWAVDLVLYGHNHLYERMYPVRQGVAVTGARQYNALTTADPPVYMVIGGAGNVEGHYTLSPSPLTAASDTAHYGYASIDFINSTALLWQWHASNTGAEGLGYTTPADGAGTVDVIVDQLLLIRDHAMPVGGYTVLQEPMVSQQQQQEATACTTQLLLQPVGLRNCNSNYTYSADFTPAPAQLVQDDNFVQSATQQHNAVLLLNAFTDAYSNTPTGSLTLLYLDDATGITHAVRSAQLLTVTAVSTVLTMTYAYDSNSSNNQRSNLVSNSSDPLVALCSPLPVATVIATYDSIAAVPSQTAAIHHNITFTCAAAAGAASQLQYLGSGYFDRLNVVSVSTAGTATTLAPQPATVTPSVAPTVVSTTTTTSSPSASASAAATATAAAATQIPSVKATAAATTAAATKTAVTTVPAATTTAASAGERSVYLAVTSATTIAVTVAASSFLLML